MHPQNTPGKNAGYYKKPAPFSAKNAGDI